MKKKLKWVVNIATLCLCACLAAIGVYAAKNATITAGGTISFKATNIFADVECEVLNAKTEVTFNKITIDATKTGETFTDNTSWAKNLEFAEDGKDITMKFTITNKATDRPLYAKITNTSSASNLNVKTGEDAFDETDWLELTANNGGSTNVKEIVITMSIANKDAAVTGNYGFNIELKNEDPNAPLDASEYDCLTFTYLDKEAKTLKVGPKSGSNIEGQLIIPAKVIFNDEVCTVTTVIGDEFGGAITSIVIEEGITTLEPLAFTGIRSLESIVLPNSVISIGNGSFSSCSSLKSITIPEGEKELKFQLFAFCTNLEIVTIPKSITTIAENVFEDCTSLSIINYAGTAEQWGAISKTDYNIWGENLSINYNYQG